MDENITKAVTICSIVLFLTGAITLFFILYRDSSRTIYLVNNEINDKVSVYQSKDKERAGQVVSGAFLAGSLKNGLEADIVIDASIIPKTTDADTFDYTQIQADATYSVEYVFAPSGEVALVKYQKR